MRKILLKDGKFKDYLKYAIGEIVLVVIGILLALQINNLNEKRKVDDNRLVIAEIVKESFEENDLALKETLIDYHNSLQVTKLRIQHTGPTVGLPRQAIVDSIRIIDFVNLKLANDLKSTVLIDNASLTLLGSEVRKALLEFTVAHQHYKIIEGNIDKLVFKLRDNHQEHISLLTEAASNSQVATSSNNLFGSDYRTWLRDPFNQNVSVELAWKIELAIASLKKLEEKNALVLKYVNGIME